MTKNLGGGASKQRLTFDSDFRIPRMGFKMVIMGSDFWLRRENCKKHCSQPNKDKKKDSLKNRNFS